MALMQLLLVTPEPPSLVHVNGGSTRQYRLYKRLIELGHEVTVIAPFLKGSQAERDSLTDAGFRVVAALRPESRAIEVGGAMLRDRTLFAAPFRRASKDAICDVLWGGIAPLVKRELEVRRFDAIVIEHAAGWIERADWTAPTLLTLHEVESPQYFAKAARVGGINGWMRRINGSRARAGEQRWLPMYDAIVTMSESETSALTQIVPNLPPTFAVGNGANPDAFELAPSTGRGRRVIFTGTMTYTPNRTAATWLAHDVWPLVRSAAPDAQLEIVGRAPTAAIRALDHCDGVTMTANAPDIRPHLEAADVCAVPMLEGGGTRLKLAEAMASGRGIVTTTNGSVGVNVADRREVLIADGAEAFAGAIVELLRDRPLRESLGAAARERARSELTWDALGERFASIIELAIHKPDSGRVSAEV